MKIIPRLSLGGLIGLSLMGFMPTVSALQVTDEIAPQAADTLIEKSLFKASDYMVASANPYATQAGFEVLEAGGNAFDAAVAVQLTLGLVEPQSSGLGGGAFMVLWDAEDQKLWAIDGRETAPKAATPELFLDDKGEPLQFMDAVVGGRSVGTPGTPALLAAVHERFGSKPWAELFQSSIALADKGFEVTDHMSQQIADSAESLQRFEATRNYFFTEAGEPLPAGFLRKNPEYANTLRLLAEKGVAPFYFGEIGEDIVKTVQNAKDNPGVLAMDDLNSYKVISRDTVCVPYRQFEVCGMGPPTSGGLTVGQILGMLNHYDLATLGPDNPESWRLFGDASRLAFADRGRYIADADFVDVPVKELVNSHYLEQRAQLLSGNQALETVEPGDPVAGAAAKWADDAALELPSTSHFVIVDKKGNIVSMTTTIENGFGSRLMTRGFLLNNELTDFSFKPEKNGVPVANRVEPGKRPRSSMSPSIVFKEGKPYMAVGSPGGARIIGYVAKTLVAHIDWGMDMQQAIALPHKFNGFGTYDLEENTSAVDMKDALEGMGYKTKVRNLNSGLHGIVITEDGLEGGADPRRDGTVLGR